MRAVDPQQNLEYIWESICIDPELSGEELGLDECEKIARSICKRHGVSMPLVIACKRRVARSFDISFSRKVRGSKNDLIRHMIALPKGTRNLVTVVHECCHFLKHAYDDGCSHHGPLFVRLMIDEISRLRGKNRKLTKNALEESAEKAGLVFCFRRSLYNNRKRGCRSRSCTECMRMYE